MSESASSSPQRVGLVLAAGSGTRLYPTTRVVNKHLLPVFDKPMIYYPLSTLMLSGIREYVVVTNPHQRHHFVELLGDGSQLGVEIQYVDQPEPSGIAQAFLLAESTIRQRHTALVLGDNLFYGQGLAEKLAVANQRRWGATLFAYPVRHPSQYGVVEFDEANQPKRLVEKPVNPLSHWAIPGLYYYDPSVVERARQLRPSPRGELEITDLNQSYLESGDLHVERFGRGFAWLDSGTEEALLQAANFVETVQQRQGFRIACLEEIAFRQGWITDRQLLTLAEDYPNEYGNYLREIARGES